MLIKALPITATLLLACAPASAQRLDMHILQSKQRVVGQQVAQVTIEQRVIIRIPLMGPPRQPPPPEPQDEDSQQDAALNAPPPPEPPRIPVVKEVKGPKCLELRRLRGAFINRASGITMVTDRNDHFRTHFDRMCMFDAFYGGFYIEPNKDGQLCAGRDVLHARNGSSCSIERFSKLVPEH